MPRSLAAVLRVALLAVAGCTSPPAGESAYRAVLSADLCPLTASTAGFVEMKDSSARTLRVEPLEDDAARLVLDVPGAPPREIRVARRDGSVFFAGSIGPGTEILRLGAAPGDTWESDGRRVTFEGWERLPLPGATYDAARISARRGPAGLEQVETWWFARGVGLVRLRSDHGKLFIDELVRSSP